MAFQFVFVQGRVAVRPDSNKRSLWHQGDAVVPAARWREAAGLGEDVVEGAQELLQEAAASRSDAHRSRSRVGQSLPAHRAPLVREGHGASADIPYDRAQHGEPLGAEDDVIAGERHDEQIGRERGTADHDGSAVDDADAGDALPIGHHGC